MMASRILQVFQPDPEVSNFSYAACLQIRTSLLRHVLVLTWLAISAMSEKLTCSRRHTPSDIARAAIHQCERTYRFSQKNMHGAQIEYGY